MFTFTNRFLLKKTLLKHIETWNVMKLTIKKIISTSVGPTPSPQDPSNYTHMFNMLSMKRMWQIM